MFFSSKSEIFAEWKRIVLQKKKKIYSLYLALEYYEHKKLAKVFKILKSKSCFPLSQPKRLLFKYLQIKNLANEAKIFWTLKKYCAIRMEFYKNNYKALSFFQTNLKKKIIDQLIQNVEIKERKFLIKRALFNRRKDFLYSFFMKILKKKHFITQKVNSFLFKMKMKRTKIIFSKLSENYLIVRSFKQKNRRKIKNKVISLFKQLHERIKIINVKILHKRKKRDQEKTKIIFFNLLMTLEKKCLKKYQRNLAIIAFKENIYEVFFSIMKKYTKNKKQVKSLFLKQSRKLKKKYFIIYKNLYYFKKTLSFHKKYNDFSLCTNIPILFSQSKTLSRN